MPEPKEIMELMSSPAYLDGTHPQHKKVQKQVQKHFDDKYKHHDVMTPDEIEDLNRGDGQPEPKQTVYVWRSGQGDNTCEDCATLDGKVFKDKKDIPKLPVHPNCKCTVEEVDTGEVDRKPASQQERKDKIPTPTPEQKEQPTLTPEQVKVKDKALLADMLPILERHEGTVAHGYACTRGYITIGRGIRIRNKANFLELDLYKKDGTPASPAEIAAEYERLLKRKDKAATPDNEARPFNRPARFYDDENALLLRPEEIERTEKDATVMHLASAKRKFERHGVDFNNLPKQVKKVILDMDYNMGGNFTAKSWPNFFAAVKDGRWEDAANNTRSSQISEDRNDWRRNTILEIVR